MTNLKPLMSSSADDWCTPENVLRLVRKVGPIALDPCSNARSIVGAARDYRRPRCEDGLTAAWSPRLLALKGLVYANPPYGCAIGAWVERCATQDDDVEVIALVPARTDTKWWQDFCAPPSSAAVCFWRGRLTFLGAPNPAPFRRPSCTGGRASTDSPMSSRRWAPSGPEARRRP